VSLNPQTDGKLQQIFRAVFNLPATCDVTTVCQTTESNWDSLAHVSLVLAIESEFGVNIDAGDTLRMTSFDAVRSVLQEMAP
jgi:acyl carrier protein